MPFSRCDTALGLACFAGLQAAWQEIERSFARYEAHVGHPADPPVLIRRIGPVCAPTVSWPSTSHSQADRQDAFCDNLLIPAASQRGTLGFVFSSSGATAIPALGYMLSFTNR